MTRAPAWDAAWAAAGVAARAPTRAAARDAARAALAPTVTALQESAIDLMGRMIRPRSGELIDVTEVTR